MTAESSSSEAGESRDQFVARMIAEGVSSDAAEQAAVGFVEHEGARIPPGHLLRGWSAQRWESAMFILLGCFLAELVGVVLTAPAFHPTESQTGGAHWGVVFLATFLPIIVLMTFCRIATVVKAARESLNGYTTLRWNSRSGAKVRDSHGEVIPLDDRRLKASAKRIRIVALVGSACVIISPTIWILRLLVGF
jgi:hypothetical protein